MRAAFDEWVRREIVRIEQRPGPRRRDRRGDPPGGGARDHAGLARRRVDAAAHGGGGGRRPAGRAHHRLHRGRAGQSRHHAGDATPARARGCRQAAEGIAGTPAAGGAGAAVGLHRRRGGALGRRDHHRQAGTARRPRPAICADQRHAGRIPGRRGSVFGAAARHIRPCELSEGNCRSMHETCRCWTSPPSSPAAPADASIRESLALARHAEALGYHRYWVAEHHNSDSHRRLGAGNPDRRHRRHHAAHPRRQRRRDAAALFQPESGRAVPRAGSDRARADRSRASAARPAATG